MVIIVGLRSAIQNIILFEVLCQNRYIVVANHRNQRQNMPENSFRKQPSVSFTTVLQSRKPKDSK
jgi:hypothetical protein